MYEFRKLDALNIACIRTLYLQEECLNMNIAQTRHYEARIRKVYDEMLRRNSYIYGCFDTKHKKLIAAITVNKCLDCYPGYADVPYVHLETFIVHKDYQNKGIGTQLLSEVLKVIRKEGCRYVIIQSNNEAIIHIAKKVGLTESLNDMRLNFV